MGVSIWRETYGSGQPTGLIVNTTVLLLTEIREDLTRLRINHFSGDRRMWVLLFMNWNLAEAGSGTLSDCKVLRGGSWNGGGVIHIRCANRDYDEPDYRNDIIGFRCARSLM